MSTKRLAIRGVLYNGIGRFTSILIVFFVTPFLLHRLGNEGYGIWSIIMSLSGYYALMDLGFRGASTKYVAEYEAVDDHDSTNQVIVTSLCIYGVLAIVVFVISAVVAIIFPSLIAVNKIDPQAVRWSVFIVGSGISSRLLGQVFAAVIVAKKRFEISNLLAVVSQLVEALLVVAALVLGYGLAGMAAVVFVVGAVTQIISWVIARRLLGGIRFSLQYCRRSMFNKLFSFSTLNVVSQGARRLTLSSGVICIGVMLGPEIVTFYAIADSLVRKMTGLGNSISSVVMPVASELDSQQRRDGLIALLLHGSRLLLSMGICVAVGFVSLGRSLIDLWIGPGYSDKTFPILCVLTLGLVARMPGNGVFTMLKGMDQMRFLARLRVAEAAVILLAAPVLIHNFGLLGMAWALVVPQCVTSGILLPVYACRRLGYPIQQYFLQVYPAAFISGLLPATAAVALQRTVPPVRLSDLVVQASCLIAVSCISLAVFALTRPVRSDVLQSLLPRRSG